MNREQLVAEIFRKKSFLCVGLDTDEQKLPEGLEAYDEPVFEFNRRIIDATRDYCVSYKLNTAFYECLGARGWEIMAKTIQYIGDTHFIIADAKRGDIGNTSDMYARAFFKDLGADAVTVAPYMGRDSVEPFLKYEDKSTILLALTSNAGGKDFQLLQSDGLELYKQVLKTSQTWDGAQRLMYVVGATRAEYLLEIRSYIPDAFLLVPGVGAQGGSLADVVRYGRNKEIGLLINASRSVIYASSGSDFAEAAALEARKMAVEMADLAFS
ncbi:MAG: orotidine-5'-phosphate decarboxylase [Flavobacteriales bacterium]